MSDYKVVVHLENPSQYKSISDLKNVMKYVIGLGKKNTTGKPFEYYGMNHANDHDIEAAIKQFLFVKQYYQKLTDRQLYHYEIGLGEYKNTVAMVLMAKEICKKVFPDYQAIYGIHTDKPHYHIHIMINSVSMHGNKYEMNPKEFRDTNALIKSICENIMNQIG